MLLTNPDRLSLAHCVRQQARSDGLKWLRAISCNFQRRVVNLSKLQHYQLSIEIHCLAFLLLGLNAQHKQPKRREDLSWFTLSEGSDLAIGPSPGQTSYWQEYVAEENRHFRMDRKQ